MSLSGRIRGRLQDWSIAVRPHTLPASVAPVFVGVSLAVHEGVFHSQTAAAAFLVAMLLQVAVNLANDYYDFRSGVDDSNQGFERACASGRIQPHRVKLAVWIVLFLSVIPGAYLAIFGGLPLIIAGVLSLLAAVGYSGGPYPYGSYALGDLSVFLFFGIVATAGTYYVQYCASLNLLFPLSVPPGAITVSSVSLAVVPGSLSTAILVINNLRDREGDAEAGKVTLAVLLGRMGSIVEFVFLLFLSYLVPVTLYLYDFSVWVLLPLFSLPLAISIITELLRTSAPSRMNHQLVRTGRLLLIHSLLLGAGILFS
ncbi:MAG: 1,4-dihydroxy-2-naphthoate polyprenyltransferase [bacterium]